jgi:hypothetical protein
MKKVLLFAVIACAACLSADYYDPYQNQGFYQGGCPGGSCPGAGCPTCPTCPAGGCPGGNFYPSGNFQPGGEFAPGGCPGGNCPAQGQGYYQPPQGYRQYPQPTQAQPGNPQQGFNDGQQAANGQQQAATRPPGDLNLEKKIRDNLKSGWFTEGYEQINVRVHDGVVTLRGFVASWDDKNALEEKVRSLEGVRNVNSQVFVRPGSPQEQKRG